MNPPPSFPHARPLAEGCTCVLAAAVKELEAHLVVLGAAFHAGWECLCVKAGKRAACNDRHALVSAMVRTRSHAVLNATWHASLHANFLSAAALCVHGPGTGTGRVSAWSTPPPVQRPTTTRLTQRV